jgi:hypothetical protein
VTHFPDSEWLRAIEQAQRYLLPELTQNILQGSEAARLSLQAQGEIDRVMRGQGLNTSVYDATTRMFAEQRAQSDLIRNTLADHRSAWKEVNLRLSDQTQQWDAVNRLLDDHVSLRSVATTMHDAQAAFAQAMQSRDLLGTGVPTSLLAAQTSVGIITGRLEELDLLATHPLLSARLLQPHAVHAQFVERAARRLRRYSTAQAMAAVEGALLVGDDLVIDSSRGIHDHLTLPTGGDEPMVVSKFNMQLVVRQELKKHGLLPANRGIDELSDVSPAAATARRARRVAKVIQQHIEADSFEGASGIFQGTGKVWAACVDLPFITVRDRATLGDLIDHLYFVFYEGTGEAKRLRAYDLMSDSECEFVWKVKHLRTWLRHDVEHGSPSDIRASRRKIFEAIRWFGLTGMPRTADDFQNLQRRLIEEAERFLLDLLARVQKQG